MTDIIDHVSHVVALIDRGLPPKVIEHAIDRSSSDAELTAQIALLLELSSAGLLRDTSTRIGPAWQQIGNALRAGKDL